MKQLRKLQRNHKELLKSEGYDPSQYMIERKNGTTLTFVHKETLEKLELNIK